MADKGPSLGDFFAKKGKNKKAGLKGINLNVENPTKTEEKKNPKGKDKEEEGWEEELVVAPTMKIETVGKLSRDEDKKEEEDTSAPAWGTAKKAAEQQLNDKRFPTLAKAVQSSNINLDNEPKVNIKTSKNMFAQLEDNDDDEGGPKMRTQIKPAMIKKQQGESEKAALQRELKQYAKDKKKAQKKEDGEEDDEEDEEEEEEEEEVKPKKQEEKKKVKKVLEPAAEPAQKADKPAVDVPNIEPDLEASKKKYEGRRKLPKVELPESELEEEKENKPKPQVSSKKKKKVFEEEDDKPKLQVWVED